MIAAMPSPAHGTFIEMIVRRMLPEVA